MKILLEGRPGVGKTTVARRLVQLLQGRHVRLTGFTTEEIRRGRSRQGFMIETIEGARAVIAHVSIKGPRVGKYGVDLEEFERLALPALREEADLVIVDELGKMELLSRPFREKFARMADDDVSFVATVHASRHSFTDALKRRADVELIRVTQASRERLPEILARRVTGEDG